MALLLAVFLILVIQRLLELRLARRNRTWAVDHGAVEHGAGHYPLFFLLHSAWFAGWLLEGWLRGGQAAPGWPLWLALFLLAQGLRYHAITTLGRRWNTRILVFPDRPPVAGGLYRWLRHPNYVAVALELLSVPLFFGAWITALVATLLNAVLLLGIRIPAENRALRREAPRP